MFLQNKYTRWYYSIVSRSTTSGQIERHHIIPKSLGGSDDSDNIACLTPREHFICHRLLVKMTSGKEKRKMSYALWRMTNCRKYKLTSRLYQQIRQSHVEQLTAQSRPLHVMEPARIARIGSKHSVETRAKMSASHKGKTLSERTKRKISDANRGRTLPPKTEEHKQKLRLAAKSQPKHTCPHCGKVASKANITRWHGSNCSSVKSL